jgi:hypothetical protein
MGPWFLVWNGLKFGASSREPKRLPEGPRKSKPHGKSKARGEESGQGIGDAPACMAEGEMGGVDVGALLFVAVRSQQLASTDA